MSLSQTWTALMIGNSRLHWATFVDETIQHTWDEPHLDERQFNPQAIALNSPLWIASVVPAQTKLWADYANGRWLALEDVPIQGMYPTLGIDRALAAWGAIATVGCPVLVIDGGTALTFTGVDANHHLIGGAILPGLRLQFEALGQKTALLPDLNLPSTHPPIHPSTPSRWALNTEAAIASGIFHTIAASIHSFVQDWQQQFPDSRVVMTGGDSDRLFHLLHQTVPTMAERIQIDPNLIFKGIQAVRSSKT